MIDEEREDLNTFKHDLVKQARWWKWKAETLEKENEHLKAENADLRERLEKAVELPFRPDDYHIEPVFARIVVSTRTQGCKIAIPIYAYINCEDENSAEARLAELKGGGV